MLRKLFDGVPESEWRAIHISSLVSIFFSILGEAYVFTHAYIFFHSKRRRNRLSGLPPSSPLADRKSPVAVAFAAAIAFSDFVFSVHHGIDHLYSIVFGRVAEGPLCRWFGFGSLWGVDSSALWSFALALYMTSLLLFGIKLDANPWWWWGSMITIAWVLPLIGNIVAVALGLVDNAGMFCMVSDRIGSLILKPGIFVFVFCFISLCYVAIGVRLITHMRQNKKDPLVRSYPFQEPVRRQQNQMRRVGLYLIGFTVVYILQFFPTSILVFMNIARKKPNLALNVLDKVLSNGNGWMNAIAYRHFIHLTAKDDTDGTPPSSPNTPSS
ncbi:hypothetical protein HK104_001827, partial [Borealophlyctis nickersoniae]